MEKIVIYSIVGVALFAILLIGFTSRRTRKAKEE